jgi:hypothetical protein
MRADMVSVLSAARSPLTSVLLPSSCWSSAIDARKAWMTSSGVPATLYFVITACSPAKPLRFSRCRSVMNASP